MADKQKIAWKIESLKNEKESLHFEMNNIFAYILAITIAIASISISVGAELSDIWLKIFSGLLFIGLMVITGLFFMKPLKKKGRRLKKINSELKNIYNELTA